ncbi:MAG: hypothetical protein QG632_154 [Candidatus Dependentiae bacterium]|nr:hypothetical protein [Candidatus Dependentiae bacterium]
MKKPFIIALIPFFLQGAAGNFSVKQSVEFVPDSANPSLRAKAGAWVLNHPRIVTAGIGGFLANDVWGGVKDFRKMKKYTHDLAAIEEARVALPEDRKKVLNSMRDDLKSANRWVKIRLALRALFGTASATALGFLWHNRHKGIKVLRDNAKNKIVAIDLKLAALDNDPANAEERIKLQQARRVLDGELAYLEKQ